MTSDNPVYGTDLFNNKAFQVVQNDLSTKNAVRCRIVPAGRAGRTDMIVCLRQKVRERRRMHPETSVTLEDILRNEKESGEMFATGALTWLLR